MAKEGTRTRVLTGLLIGATAVLAGCQAAAPPRAPVGVIAAPMDVEGTFDSTWEYLRQKYDANGDAIIAPEEYTREGGRFDRLDRNHDGELSPDDFASGGGGGRGSMMRGMRTQRLVARHFQDDENPESLSLAELERSLAAYDADGDGTLDRREFEDRAASRRVEDPGGGSRMMRMAMRDVDLWDMLLQGIDDDGDGRISGDELVDFFKDRDDGDLVWTLGRTRGGAAGGAGRPGRQVSTRPMSGAPEGEMAPDFTLGPPEGGRPVRLSSFRRNLPVALIFGSYT